MILDDEDVQQEPELVSDIQNAMGSTLSREEETSIEYIDSEPSSREEQVTEDNDEMNAPPDGTLSLPAQTPVVVPAPEDMPSPDTSCHYTYSELTAMALLRAPGRCLDAGGICDWIEQHFPHYAVVSRKTMSMAVRRALRGEPNMVVAEIRKSSSTNRKAVWWTFNVGCELHYFLKEMRSQ